MSRIYQLSRLNEPWLGITWLTWLLSLALFVTWIATDRTSNCSLSNLNDPLFACTSGPRSFEMTHFLLNIPFLYFPARCAAENHNFGQNLIFTPSSGQFWYALGEKRKTCDWWTRKIQFNFYNFLFFRSFWWILKSMIQVEILQQEWVPV